MSGIKDITQLLASMEPTLNTQAFVFCTSQSLTLEQAAALNPQGLFLETEGITLILTREDAQVAGFDASSDFRQITLTVHSSLEAVGLTAAIAAELAQAGISANVVAAYYHDHIFVPAADAQRALAVLTQLQQRSALA